MITWNERHTSFVLLTSFRSGGSTVVQNSLLAR